jgi:murein endopeptidase
MPCSESCFDPRGPNHTSCYTGTALILAVPIQRQEHLNLIVDLSQGKSNCQGPLPLRRRCGAEFAYWYSGKPWGRNPNPLAPKPRTRNVMMSALPAECRAVLSIE